MLFVFIIILSLIIMAISIIYKKINKEKLRLFRLQRCNTDENYKLYYRHNDIDDILSATIVLNIMLSICFSGISLIILSSSYFKYLDDRTFYDSTVYQYRDQIKMQEKEVIIYKNGVITDLVNMGFQKEVSIKISTLTENVIDYNKSIIKKRILKKNPIFSWLIIEPDSDMKILSLN